MFLDAGLVKDGIEDDQDGSRNSRQLRDAKGASRKVREGGAEAPELLPQ